MHALAQPSTRHSDIKLRRLHTEYVDAFLRSDVDWYRRHLAEEFRCITARGELLDRDAFLRGAAGPVGMTAFDVDDVNVEFFGDTAVVQSRTVYEKTGGSRSQTRHTGVWIGRDGRWQALCAQSTAVAEPPDRA